MGRISDLLLDKVKDKYALEGKSMSQIADELHTSINAVVYFMRKHKIQRRSAVERSKITFFNKAPSFKLKRNLVIDEQILKYIGVTLYWGEGHKSKTATNVDFANSDPGMINVFMSFLRNICGIDESKLRVYLYCYENQKPEELMKYWSRITKIPLKNFTKPYVRYDYKDEKKGKMMNGLIHVRYYDKKLLLQLLNWIEELKAKYS